jgi:LysM repeat protein
VKVTHLTETTEHDLASSPLFHEAYVIGRQLNLLLEAQALTPAQVEELFAAAEETMTGTGKNKTLLGKVGAGVGAVVDKVKGLGRLLQDTTVVRGLDQAFDDAKAKISAKMGQSEGGAQVLQKLDAYRQFWEKYPVTGKFMYGLLTVLTGYASAGMTGPILLGATKTADDLLKNKSFSGSVGAGAMQGGTAAAMVGAKHAVGAAVDAATPVVKNIGQGINSLGQAAQAGANKLGSAISQGAQNFADNAKDLIPNANAADPSVVTPSAQTVTPSATDTITPPKPAVDPNAPTPNTVTPPAAPAPHTTIAGDQLGKLAAKSNTTTQAILDANPDLAAKLNPALNGKDLGQGVNINIPKNTVPAGTNPFTGNKFFKMGESVKFKAGRGVLEGISVGYLSKSEMFDRAATLQKWSLNESLGRTARPLYLSERGIETLFDNVEKLWERDIEEARRGNYGREISNRQGQALSQKLATGTPGAQDALAQAKDAQAGNASNARHPYAPFLSSTPVGEIPGGKPPRTSAPAPADTTTPEPEATPADATPATPPQTTYTGPVGNKFMDKVEKGLSTAGAAVGRVVNRATTKVNKQRLMRMWTDAGSPTDVDSVGQILARNGVPQEYIMSLFSTMGLPAPQNLTPAKTTFSDDDIIDAANAAMRGGPPLTTAQKVRLDAIRKRQGLGPVDAPVDDRSGAAGSTGGSGGGTGEIASTTQGSGTALGNTGNTGGASGGDGQTAMATTMILPQIARMVGTAYADDLITIIDTAMSVLQRSAPMAYREKLMQLRGQNTGKQREKAQDIITRVKNKKKKGAPGATPDADPAPDTRLGLNPVPSVDPHSIPAQIRAAESRKVFGGRYIKESADAKIAREFEKFVMAME